MLPKADAPIAKSGQKTLAELDGYRYVEAPAMFASARSSQAMQLGHVQRLVEWKLYVFARLILGVSCVFSFCRFAVHRPFGS